MKPSLTQDRKRRRKKAEYCTEATQSCVQAYRKLALTKHPDKQRDNPNAAAEFNAIQRAYEKVLDPGFRDAWNQLAKCVAS